MSTNDNIQALSRQLLHEFDLLSGRHPGWRPMHAKGLLLSGTFRPTAEAATLSRATHFTQPKTPVTVRFSNFSGLPTTPDLDPKAEPRGCAVHFHLPGSERADIIAHSTPYFPVGNGSDFLAMLRAMRASHGQPTPGSPLELFFRQHPAARAFAVRPVSLASSFALEAYYGLTALRFVNEQGAYRYGRLRLVPEAGTFSPIPAPTDLADPDALFAELLARLERGPVGFRLLVQLPGGDDPVLDTTRQWPESRPLVEAGHLMLTHPVPDSDQAQQRLVFDPIPRLAGLEPSDDPLLELRAAVYQLSGQRRQAESAALAANSA